jgi:tetratricopeptide (TPR) repeat protein
VLYHQTNATPRQGLHLHLARTLEQVYGDSRDRHVLEIAHHLVRAGSVADSATVVRYARRAGDQAFAMFAWGEAAHYYEAVLAAAKATALLSTHERAELHYWSGLTQYRNGDIARCLEHYTKAIEAYRLTGDLQGLAQALLEKTNAYCQHLASYSTLIDAQSLEAMLQALGDRELKLRGNIAARMAQVYWTARQTDKAEEMARGALEIGQRLQDERLCAQASFMLGLAQSQDFRLSEALESFQTGLVHAQRANDLWLQSCLLTRMPVVLIQMGRLDEAETIALRACDITRSIHDWSDLSQALASLACVNVAKGNFADGETYTRETVTVGSRSGYPWGCTRALYALTCAYVWRGSWAAAEDSLDMLATPGRAFESIGTVVQIFTPVFRQLLQGHMGKRSEGREPSVAEMLSTGGDDMYALGPLCAIVEIGALTASPAIAGMPCEVLSRAVEQGLVVSSWGIFLIPRILGVAAALNNWWDRAEEHFQAAIDTATCMGVPPELGRSYLDYARMLRARGRESDRHRALALAERAGRLLKTLEMTPFAQQAAQLVEALQDHTPEVSQQQAVARNGHRKEGETLR